jgi:hypothetical protein
MVMLHEAAASTLPTSELAAAMALDFASALAGHRAEQQALTMDWMWRDLADNAFGTVCSLLTLNLPAALRGLFSLLLGTGLTSACLRLNSILEGPGDKINHLATALDDPAVRPLFEALRDCRRVQVPEAGRIAMMLLAAAGYNPEFLIECVGSSFWKLWVEAPVLEAGCMFSSSTVGLSGDAQQHARVVSERLGRLMWPLDAAARMAAAREHLDTAKQHLRSARRQVHHMVA